MKHCKACPYKDAPDGCPCWIDPIAGFTETNVVTGEERFIEGCFYQVVPKLMVHCVKAANGAHEMTSTVRNEMVQGFGVMANAIVRARGQKVIEAPTPGEVLTIGQQKE